MGGGGIGSYSKHTSIKLFLYFFNYDGLFIYFNNYDLSLLYQNQILFLLTLWLVDGIIRQYKMRLVNVF